MRGLLLLLAVGLGTNVNANANLNSGRVLSVHGVDVPAENLEYYAGSQSISQFEIRENQSFPFPRGNAFTASDQVYLHRGGSISLLLSTENADVRWVKPDGQVLRLNCSRRAATITIASRPRVLRFFENQEYNGGCDLIEPLPYRGGGSDLVLDVGEIDLQKNGALEFAGKVRAGTVSVGTQSVQLQSGSSLALYESGQPRFFTMKMGESFQTQQGALGLVTWSQSPKVGVSVSLFPDGRVERGILGQDLTIPELGAKVPAGTGVVLLSPDAVSILIYADDQQFESPEASFKFRQLRIDRETPKFDLVTSDATSMFIPSTLETIQVPAGSIIGVSPQGQILSVQVPRPN